MLKVSIPSWIRNAAAALCGRHGAVPIEPEQASCSRQTVYDHGRQLVERLAERDEEIETLRAEAARVHAEREALQQRLQEAVVVGTAEFERFTVTGQAMGVSLRQAEELLGDPLPATARARSCHVGPLERGRRPACGQGFRRRSIRCAWRR